MLKTNEITTRPSAARRQRTLARPRATYPVEPRTRLARLSRPGLTAVLIVVLGCLVLGGHARSAAAGTCVWAADRMPWFPPGVQPVEDQGQEQETCKVDRNWHGVWEEKTYRQKSWAVCVYPGYVYSHLMAMEELVLDCFGEGHGAAGVTLDKCYARTAFYCVGKKAHCKNPQTEVHTQGSAKFQCYVRQNHGEAHMAGLTTVRAVMTKLNVIATAGAEIGMPQSERTGSISFTLSAKPAVTVTVPLRFHEDQTEDMDAASHGDVGDGAVVDEEWVITTRTDGRCYAEGSSFQHWSDARAIQSDHHVWMRTECYCRCCRTRAVADQQVKGTSYGVTEQEWTPEIAKVGGKTTP